MGVWAGMQRSHLRCVSCQDYPHVILFISTGYLNNFQECFLYLEDKKRENLFSQAGGTGPSAVMLMGLEEGKNKH